MDILRLHVLQLALAVHTQSLWPCPALCDPMDSSPQGSSVRGNLQEDPLEEGMATHSSILA